MKIITIPIISRGPQVETSIGIIIVLIVVAIIFFAGYRTYQGFLKTIDESVSSLEEFNKEVKEINF